MRSSITIKSCSFDVGSEGVSSDFLAGLGFGGEAGLLGFHLVVGLD